jgi:hypothetical protein
VKGETRRALLRHHMYIPPWEKVRVAFIIYGPNDVRAILECLTCECPMEWDERCQYWQCPECEYELTPGEARDLQYSVQTALDELFGTKRSWLWDLVNWWRRRRADRSKRLPQQT